MWNTYNLDEQIQLLLNHYPSLSIAETDYKQIRLKGTISIYRSACNYTLCKDYAVELFIPVSATELPKIKCTDNSIDVNYPHRYTNGTLCLETDTTIKFRFIDGFNLVDWMDEYVEIYFFSYEYYMRYGRFPFGERSHGFIGIIESYRDIFNETDYGKIYALLQYSAENSYHGHIECPCGSGLRLRKCHGSYLFPHMTDMRKKHIIQNDYNTIRKEVLAIESARRNSNTPKQQ